MKIGIVPPMKRGLATNPAWARSFLKTVEEIGVESVWVGEHPIADKDCESQHEHFPGRAVSFPPATEICDPMEWLGFAAEVTERVMLGAGVLLPTVQAPIILAKQVAALDALSDGRVLLGVGIGCPIEERQTIDTPYEEHADRLDDGITAMRTMWTQSPATHKGQFYRFDQVSLDPKPAQRNGVHIIIGGSNDAAARRAGRIGDGFFPHAISPDDFGKRIEAMRSAAKEAGRNPDELELSVSPTAWKFGASMDYGIAKAYADLGVSRLVIGAQDAQSNELRDIERYVKECRDEVFARL